MGYELMICEKDDQAKSIASALSLHEESVEILVPNKEYYSLSKKLSNPQKQLQKLHVKKNDLEVKYQDMEKLKQMKQYLAIEDKINSYQSKINEIKSKMGKFVSGLKKQQMRYWKNDQIILISCIGHLLGIMLTNKKEDMNSSENEDEEDNNDGNDEEIDDDEESDSFTSEINFYTKIKLPSPFKESEVTRWLKFKLVEYFALKKKDTIDRFICATDYDREGQLIFGTLMVYFNIPLEDCLCMKFSTLEDNVLLDAYQNLIPFNVNLYESGNMRRWMDFVIGFNLNPLFSQKYRQYIEQSLIESELDEDVIKRVKYGNTFNMGRVKLVIMDYIYEHTKEQLEKVDQFEEEEIDSHKFDKYRYHFTDDNGYDRKIKVDVEYDEKLGIIDNIHTKLQLKVLEESTVEEEIEFTDREIPSFLNLTKVFQICSNLGASTEEINSILEYLYLQKYISYPRSKSECWEKNDDDERMEYAQSVLSALEDIGYTIKEYYHDTWGNEGEKSDDPLISHPCIHPLPSLTVEKIEILKELNPLAYLVFNNIAIHTIKCFEKNPIIKSQILQCELIRPEIEPIIIPIEINNMIEIVEKNILSFEGFDSWDIIDPINITIDKLYDVFVLKEQLVHTTLLKSNDTIDIITDFDVVNYLNENDIGTDATRSVLVHELVDKQYLVSNNALLTTFLGNQMTLLAQNYVSFIDMDYTIEMESYLNKIQFGKMDKYEFMDKIKQLIIEVYQNVNKNPEYIEELLEKYPECEEHGIKMVVTVGKFGKFMLCPHFYSEEHCNQKFSL